MKLDVVKERFVILLFLWSRWPTLCISLSKLTSAMYIILNCIRGEVRGRSKWHLILHPLAGESVSTGQEQLRSFTGPGGKVGLGSIIRKAATAAKQAVAAVAANQSFDPNAPLPLRCCLMSLSLPWDALAHDLLYEVYTLSK